MVASLEPGLLRLGHIGDCSAFLILASAPWVIELTEPHTPERRDEFDRIHQAGGFVFRSRHGVYRVNGELNVSRSIGSVKHRPSVSAECDYHEIELDPHYQHLVMCSDGLLEKLTAQDIAEYVHHTSSMGLTACEISNGLVQ